MYGAKLGAARIARSLGEMPRAIALVEAAQALQARFNTAFWCADIETYALALDGDKQPCRVRTSNPGHCLFTGIAHAERARQIIAGFGDEHFFSGWGVRTRGGERAALQPDVVSQRLGLAARQRVARGRRGALRRQDVRAAHPQRAVRGGTAFRPAAPAGAVLRIPAQGREAPLHFPVACSPQAASAGATFLLLQSVLGICIDALDRQIVLAHPVVPDGFEEIRVKNLEVAEASVDFTVRRHGGSVSVSVERREGKLDLVIRS